MRDLIIEEKTGFRSSLPFTINDINGNLFYSSDFTDKIKRGEVLEFNLPLGVYRYDGNFIKLSHPVNVVSISLPIRERNYNNKRYEIVFADNPHKCTIFYDEGVILFDTQFLSKPLYIKYVIYFHELGHHYYQSEDKADLYSAKKLLDLGFNPSQIGRGFLEGLSVKSFERMEKIINVLTKNQG